MIDEVTVINEPKRTECGAPESVWSAYIGGYQPAAKWLKDRRDRTLSHNDLTHYHRLLTALKHTQKLMEQVDTNFLFAKKESLTKKTENNPPIE
jgi:hypothetical protein